MNTPEGIKLVLAHPNAKCTGCKIELSLIPAREGREGCINMYMKKQSSIIEWDEENYGLISLTFNDVANILQVFRGELESIREGKGIYHIYGRSEGQIPVVFHMRHIIEPCQGYRIELKDGSDTFHFLLTPAEALGLCCSFEMALHRIAFG